MQTAQKSTPIHKTIRTTTEVSPWKDEYYKITGGHKKVQVGNDQENAQSERNSHSKLVNESSRTNK